jgi:hypothetical protein
MSTTTSANSGASPALQAHLEISAKQHAFSSPSYSYVHFASYCCLTIATQSYTPVMPTLITVTLGQPLSALSVAWGGKIICSGAPLRLEPSCASS